MTTRTPPGGERGVSLYEVTDGRIVAEPGVADVLGLVRQLGAV